jgi:MFS family permease
MVTKEEEKKERLRIREKTYKARQNSIKAGMFTSARSSFGDYYLSPFAIAINASNSLVALLTSLSGLFGPISQMFGSRLIEKYPRKKVFLRSALFESLAWLPMIVIAILYMTNIIQSVLPLLFSLFYAFYVVFLNMGTPAWFSWTGDIVNERYRGRWFSKRNLLAGAVSVVLAMAAALTLDLFKKAGLAMFGFIILFALAFLSRLTARHFYKKQYEPKLELKEGSYFSFFSFLIKGRKTNFAKFSFFSAFLNMAVAVASPLFAIYMLRDLNFSYVTYMMITLSTVVFSLLVLELWGKISDKFGNYVVLYISGALIPLVPLLWIFSHSPIYLIFGPVFISGVAWAGFNLASSNFIYDNVHQEKRGLAISYYNMLNGMGIFVGAGIGAILIEYIHTPFMDPILFIFLISGILRMIVVGIFIPLVKEVRKVKDTGNGGLRHLILRQFRPTVIGEVHQILSIKKYLRK